MSHATLQIILKEIEAPSEEDRDLLQDRLAELDEARWRKEANEARHIARRAGVDQASIDQTIERIRHS